MNGKPHNKNTRQNNSLSGAKEYGTGYDDMRPTVDHPDADPQQRTTRRRESCKAVAIHDVIF
jgi:hypothetical protein